MRDNLIGIPVLISWKDPKGNAFWDKFQLGNGSAGWTVIYCEPTEVFDTLQKLPKQCWMPGTYRLAKEYDL